MENGLKVELHLFYSLAKLNFTGYKIYMQHIFETCTFEDKAHRHHC